MSETLKPSPKHTISTRERIKEVLEKAKYQLIISQNNIQMTLNPNMGHFQKLPLLWENERAQTMLDKLNGKTDPNPPTKSNP